jgi:polysaccharide deacetylase family protein (PEP-CTERM system associated)
LIRRSAPATTAAGPLNRKSLPIVLNAFTVDVEDYFQVTSFEGVVSRADWNRHESRVVGSTRRILDLLARHNVRGTFFVLGWVAERYSSLVREIKDGGHELACHSYWHRLVYQQTNGEFRDDLRRAKAAIEDAAGCAVTAYRAPSFSITRKSLWALEVLLEEGFTVDSSLFPTRHDRYGIPDAPEHIHAIETPAGSISEFPMTVQRFGRLTLPVGGGGYFRLYPYSLTRRLLRRTNVAGQRPFVFYVHPWEVDVDQPRIRTGSRLSRFRHYVNLASTEAKLDRLLSDFRFGRMCDVLALRPAASVPVAVAG